MNSRRQPFRQFRHDNRRDNNTLGKRERGAHGGTRVSRTPGRQCAPPRSLHLEEVDRSTLPKVIPGGRGEGAGERTCSPPSWNKMELEVTWNSAHWYTPTVGNRHEEGWQATFPSLSLALPSDPFLSRTICPEEREENAAISIDVHAPIPWDTYISSRWVQLESCLSIRSEIYLIPLILVFIGFSTYFFKYLFH